MGVTGQVYVYATDHANASVDLAAIRDASGMLRALDLSVAGIADHRGRQRRVMQALFS